MKTLVWERRKGISWITLNRPEIRNAVNYDMMDELSTVLTEIENTNDQLLVITGSGERAFCSGGDLTLFHSLHSEQEAYAMLSKMGSVLKQLFLFKKPTVALLNGAAVGGGCELATACDFRIAKRGVKFGFVQGTLGITTGWGGGTMLYERITPTLALHYLLSSQLISSEKGFEEGFIHFLIEEGDLKEQCEKILTPYLNQSNDVLSAYKQMWLQRLHRSKVLGNIEKEIKTCAKLWESDEHHDAVQKFLNK
ncbi:enoyl-CoA hydratase/isomerase family protein [Pueribacillus sp. YX66]|uniref:enoyl-CoA hydratase/isomerase family protein n=1 Tax=Pueribacillus sp. YX66 TaxID=3229242 RepID=UPI00358D661F